MRNYLDDPNLRLPQAQSRRPLLAIGVLAVLAAVLIVIDQAGLAAPVRGQAEALLAPGQLALSGARQWVAGLAARPGELERLRAELAAERERASALETAVVQAQAVLVENEHLRNQLDIEQRTPWQLAGARVTVRSPDAGRRMVMIDQGADSGIRPGMAVIGREGGSPPALVGIVEEVGPASSSILLITDYGSSISAVVYHAGIVADGIVEGQWQRGSRLRLEQVPRSMTMAPGDIVMTAGLTAALGADLPLAAVPRDVPIGIVEAVRPESQTQSAELRPFVDPDRLDYVWVIVSHDG